jgi:hypothetical protein
MVTPNFNSLCKQAELYCYDFLSDKSQGPIPEFIVNHINQCPHCYERVNQLKTILSQPEVCISLEQKQINSVIANWLSLQFTYVGKRVTCETVKLFLPGFLEPALNVKIPTPITVHLHSCPKCLNDLETIRELKLSTKQLCRLSNLFLEKANENNFSCSQAQEAIPSVVSMALNETDKDTLKHLCVCPDCRKRLHQYREQVCNESLNNKTGEQTFICDEISASDFFDYVVPYGLDPANDQYTKFRRFFTSHASVCPVCLANMQQLHNTVFGIVERAESGIATIYHIGESVKTKAVESGAIYAGFPIRVEMVKSEDEIKVQEPVVISDVASKRRMPVINIRPLFKVGIAAAILLAASVLFMNISTAKAVTLEGIYKAIEKVKNVHISSFIPNKKEPVQQQWVSRTLNVNMIKTEKESVLWDAANKIKKNKYLNSNTVQTANLTAEMSAESQNMITGSLGLLPFNSLSEIPSDAKWKSVGNINQGIADKTEVYDLIWVEKIYDGHITHKKWRFFVGFDTNLPQRIEIYQKSDTDSEYILKYTRVVEYLDDSKMQNAIKEASF